jgi:hypothetical protein
VQRLLNQVPINNIKVTGVVSVLTFLEKCKTAMECRKKGTTNDGQLAETMDQV